MRFDEHFYIDNAAVLLPDADVEVSISDMESDDSGRDESGVLHRILLRPRVRTWTLKYSTLTEAEYQYLLNLVAGKPSFTVGIIHDDGSDSTYQAYCPEVGVTIHDKRRGIYRNLTLQITEC